MHIQDSCYKISSTGTFNWNAAKSACEAMGSKLAMVKSRAEQQALAPKISEKTWIGLHRDRKDMSRWMWVDGSRARYTNWYSKEPNNLGGNEDCAHFWPSAHSRKWNDMRCSYKMYYVCETSGRLLDRCFSLCEDHVILEEMHSSCHIAR